MSAGYEVGFVVERTLIAVGGVKLGWVLEALPGVEVVVGSSA